MAVALAAALVAVGGCGGDEDGGGATATADAVAGADAGDPEAPWPVLPAAAVDEQGPLAEADLAKVGAPCFAGVLAKAKADGFSTFAAAGVTAAGAVEVTWAELLSSSGEPRAVVARCDGDCVCGVGQRKDGLAVFVDEAGAPVTIEPVGRPVLAKTLTGSALDSATKLDTKSGALVEDPPTIEPTRFQGKRRLVFASAFGDVFGVEMSGLLRDGTKTGVFTAVEERPYIRAAEMDALLDDLHGQDVLVWFAHGVRTDKGASGFKPEGMTVNRGLFGDETYDRARLEAALAEAPLGGPGLLVLAGSETFGSAAKGLQPFAALQHLVQSADARRGAVVGFRGRVGAEDALLAVRVMLAAWYDGESLSDALAAGTAELASRGSEATLETNLDADAAGAYTLLPSLASYWGAAAPSGGQFVGYLLISGSSKCGTTALTEQTVQFFTDITFEGPFFHGSKSLEGGEVEVFGLLEHLQPGARFEVIMRGTPNELVHGITVLGDAQFCPTGGCAGEAAGVGAYKPGGGNMTFAGSADASSFTNASNEDCVLTKPTLTQKGGKPGWILLNP